jgi:hypothetical protein
VNFSKYFTGPFSKKRYSFKKKQFLKTVHIRFVRQGTSRLKWI